MKNISPPKKRERKSHVTRKSPLRAVTPQDSAPKPSPKSLKEAADRGERELLVSMRNAISDAVAAGVPAHALAPLMRQLREIDKEIRAFDLRAEQKRHSDDAADEVDESFDASAI
jgi:hypothetical protein